MDGKKFDIGKPQMSLVPDEFIQGIARVMTFGAKKYGAWNWSKGMNWSRVLDATYRHVGAWERGMKEDNETGESHLLHASCCLMFLYIYERFNLGKDDRWERPDSLSNKKKKLPQPGGYIAKQSRWKLCPNCIIPSNCCTEINDQYPDGKL